MNNLILLKVFMVSKYKSVSLIIVLYKLKTMFTRVHIAKLLPTYAPLQLSIIFQTYTLITIWFKLLIAPFN